MRDVVLGLDDLLRGLRDLGGVSEGKVVGDLLFDRDRRCRAGRRGLRVQPLGVNFDAADAKKPLGSVAEGGIQGLAENQVGGLLAKAGLRGTGKRARFTLCAAQGEQRDNVGVGQRRLGAIGEVELLRRSIHAERDVIVADMGGRF